MARSKAVRRVSRPVRAFSVRTFLDAVGTGRAAREYRRGETIFTQGDPCESVFYIQTGGVRLSSRSKTGQEAVVALLGPQEFFGEACLGDELVRSGTATAATPTLIRIVPKHQMAQLLQAEHGMSDRFIAHLLSRNTRIEEALVTQLFNMGKQPGR